MPWTPLDKWAAFWLSIAMPGLGQLWTGRWSCLAYFAAVAGAPTLLPGPVARFALVALGFVAAEHAKRCVEADRWRGRTRSAAVRSRVVDGSGRGRAISMRIELEVNRRPSEVWARVSDFEEFVTIDPYHCRVILLGPERRPGVELALEHRVFGIRFLRFGRLLTWREGRGYAFSDLSGRRGPRGFFPHVFDFAVVPIGPGDDGPTRLVVAIRGRWNSRWVPRWAGSCWVRYVCGDQARLLRDGLS